MSNEISTTHDSAETRVLHMVLRGRTRREIAAALHLDEAQVTRTLERVLTHLATETTV